MVNALLETESPVPWTFAIRRLVRFHLLAVLVVGGEDRIGSNTNQRACSPMPVSKNRIKDALQHQRTK
jgi:hypothetical protein